MFYCGLNRFWIRDFENVKEFELLISSTQSLLLDRKLIIMIKVINLLQWKVQLLDVLFKILFGTLLKHNENSWNLPKSIKELPATIKKVVRFDIFVTIFTLSSVVYKNLCDAPYMESHNNNMSLFGRFSLFVLFSDSIKNVR